MRIPPLGFVFFPFLLWTSAASAEETFAITLADVLAIELPVGVSQGGPGDSPLRELLSAARSGSSPVTSDLQRKVGPGPVRVTWTAWDGSPKLSKPTGTRTARVIILPAGMTPVGVSGDENATAGNNAAHVVRDSIGRVHMIWADSGRPSGRTGPVYRRAIVNAKGVVQFETEPVYVAEDTPGDWNSYPALAAAGDTVQLIWQGGGTARTRRLTSGPSGWTLGPIRDTGAISGGRDVGPAVAIDGSGGVHIVTPDGIYAWSRDRGQTWQTETIPLPAGQHIKTESIAADPSGAVHIAFSSVVMRPDPPAGKLGGYWQLRTITRSANGTWVNPIDALAGVPGWSEPHGTDDVLADWVRIAADRQGGLHLTWHGTVNSRKFSNDAAFYAYRGPGGSWQKPVQLIPQDAARGIKFSFAPSLALEGGRALPLAFYDVYDGPNWTGFDSSLAVFRDGRLERALIPVTQFVRAAIEARRPETALSSRFPAAAPAIWHSPDGRLWLDVLEMLKTDFEPRGPNLIVYHRLDVTQFLGRS